MPQLPDTSTMAQAGLKDFVVTVYLGFFVPAKTPPEVASKLAEALIAFDGGQASLVLNGAAQYGPSDTTAIIGTRGTVSSRGPDLGAQSVELYTQAGVARPTLKGTWFNDGFAGTMGELLCAIEERREPRNSARGNLASLRLCLAAVRSSRTGETVSI